MATQKKMATKKKWLIKKKKWLQKKWLVESMPDALLMPKAIKSTLNCL